jgi:phosphatidylserine/phosphatidylglycerophosphate/cardiolipin synthase-like enzyme
LTNSDLRRPIRVGSFSLTDSWLDASQRAATRDSQRMAQDDRDWDDVTSISRQKPRVVRLPEGTVLKAGEEIWLAHRGDAFYTTFGYLPDYEAVDTRSDVPNLNAPDGWIFLTAKKGMVALRNASGEVVDFVAYDRHQKVKLSLKGVPKEVWRGGAVRLWHSSSYGWTGQILARDRNELGHLLADTNTARDWDGGNSVKQLGTEPTHRVELPGQSHFVTKTLRNVHADVLVTSAPDNNYQALIEAFNKARKTIRVSVYQITNVKIAEALIKALRRKVKVTLWLEGSPVGGIPDQERYLVNRLRRAGAEVYFLISAPKERIRSRYRFDHSKYVIIDDETAIIGTENYGRTGVPVDPSYGNRGWMVHVKNRQFVRQLRRVWDHDFKPGKIGDVRSIDHSPSDPYGLPYRDRTFEPSDLIPRGLYEPPRRAVRVQDRMNLELVLSPDTSLNEGSAIIGMINRAKKTLYVEQNSIRRRWGRKHHTVEEAPNLPLEAVVKAARRGVKVRVLLDSTWYNITGDDDRDNDDTVRFLNSLARNEGLDIAAKVINRGTTHLEKIHTKGVIVDEREVFVGSINWSENSFKGNREVGVVIGHPKVAGYYSDLFWRDWRKSRIYQAEVLLKGAKVRTAPHAKAKVVAQLRQGAHVDVIAEMGEELHNRAEWAEIQTPNDGVGYVAMVNLGRPRGSPEESIHLVDRFAKIQGRVLATKVGKKAIHLWFGGEVHPIFTVVIFRNAEAKLRQAGLDPSQAFQGREVEIEGRIQTWKSPEIIISDPTQIRIIR